MYLMYLLGNCCNICRHETHTHLSSLMGINFSKFRSDTRIAKSGTHKTLYMKMIIILKMSRKTLYLLLCISIVINVYTLVIPY